MMTVSLCVVAYNEENYLPNLLKDIENQTYPHNLTEILLIDSGSIDRTKQLMRDFAEKRNSYINVKVLDNPKKILAAGWNIAISNSTGDVIIRIDAHAHIPADFTAKNMDLQEKGEYITGGMRPCLIENPTPWKETLLAVENSIFGSSISKERKSTSACYVKSMFHAAYRRKVFEEVGNYNESLLRTEDNEMHYRMRKAGFNLYYDPSIVSYQYARNSLQKMVKQKNANGYWIGLTLGVSPKCFSVFHFIPFVFVLGIAITTLLAFLSFWQFAVFMWFAYFLFALFAMVNIILKNMANRWTILMPILFLIIHISYGLGTLSGIICMLLKKHNMFES